MRIRSNGSPDDVILTRRQCLRECNGEGPGSFCGGLAKLSVVTLGSLEFHAGKFDRVVECQHQEFGGSNEVAICGHSRANFRMRIR